MINENTDFDTLRDLNNNMRRYAQGYKQNIIMIPAGCDFAWTGGDYSFSMIDGLIDFVRKYEFALKFKIH